MQTSTPLDALQRPDEYRATRARIFPSEGSFEWFSRRYREQLIDAGGLVRVGGKWYVNHERCDAFVLSGGKGCR